MTINSIMAALVDELAANEIPAPLTQPLTLGLIWLDLCRLAGEPVPADVAALAETPVALAAD